MILSLYSFTVVSFPCFVFSFSLINLPFSFLTLLFSCSRLLHLIFKFWMFSLYFFPRFFQLSISAFNFSFSFFNKLSWTITSSFSEVSFISSESFFVSSFGLFSNWLKYSSISSWESGSVIHLTTLYSKYVSSFRSSAIFIIASINSS